MSLGPSHTGRTIGTTVGASSVTLVEPTQNRRSVLIQNEDDTNVVYVTWGETTTATAANSIALAPAADGPGTGGSMELSEYMGAVYVIGSGAGTDVRYGETGGS